MKKSIRILISAVITLIIAAALFYVWLPAINVYNQEFWIFLTVLVVVFAATYVVIGLKRKKYDVKVNKQTFKSAGVKVFIIAVAIPVVVLIVGNVISSTFFNAAKYSQIIEVKEAIFEEDMPETGLVTNIALMDSDSAKILGDRKLGALSEVVSQYQIGAGYSQINYKGAPQKVANLEYVDFFKWFNNKDKGVPGYVMVDPVNSSADYIALSTPMKYVDSAYFAEDLHRALRMSYPTKIFGNYSFELDEAGNPYCIVSCMSPKVGMFGAMDVTEVVVFNPCDGSHTLYALSETPSWIDNVFTGQLASQKYDWYGTLKNGFWNSVIGNKDCKVTTDDFGYIVIEDDVWFFTGVTSVSSDESNIGFIISNARTGEYKFYPVIGAEEYSAMMAAEGEVQEKGYVASFPSLINAAGEATYIMVLKDNGGLVKLYALVNVENYSIVATGTTQAEAKQAYIDLLRSEGIIKENVEVEPVTPQVETKQTTITVKKVTIATVDGNSVVYINGDDGNIYKKALSADETLLLIKEGDKIDITYIDIAGADKIKELQVWGIKE
ncbi:MAG: hypothetical protein E7653_00590 [Ruminococcaceae bacterium]|nr:hypothetical protein [Oscillospiraceae bacterium]